MIVDKIVKLLKEQYSIILISSTTLKSLVSLCDYNLYLSPYENHYNKISSFSTRLSLLYLLDCIYTCYFKLDYDKMLNIKQKHI
ncbi:MAG: hypothetical protein ACLRQF_20780 [Thomasclavelia ramosa]